MKYFTMAEMTATTQKFDNTPSEAQRINIIELVETVLDPLREAWGSAIRINSGFRSEKVNAAVGGANTSSHRIGSAADLWPVNGKFEEFKKFVLEFMKGRKFDQCIIEKNSAGSQWIHIGLRHEDGRQRGVTFNLSA